MPAKETPPAIFPSTCGHGCTKLFQTSCGKKTRLTLGMATKTIIKQTSLFI